jgi:hypothetical protein
MKPIPDTLLERVEDELLEGESLLWVGQPGKDAGDLLPDKPNAALLAYYAAAMVAGQLAILLAYSALRLPNTLLPVVMLLVTAAALAGVFAVLVWFARRRVRDVLYAVTNRRALMLFGQQVQSYGEGDMQFIERRMRPSGRGDVVFKRVLRPRQDAAGQVEEQLIGFMDVENPRHVEALMLQTFRGDQRFGGFEKTRREADDTADEDAQAQAADAQRRVTGR